MFGKHARDLAVKVSRQRISTEKKENYCICNLTLHPTINHASYLKHAISTQPVSIITTYSQTGATSESQLDYSDTCNPKNLFLGIMRSAFLEARNKQKKSKN